MAVKADVRENKGATWGSCRSVWGARKVSEILVFLMWGKHQPSGRGCSHSQLGLQVTASHLGIEIVMLKGKSILFIF